MHRFPASLPVKLVVGMLALVATAGCSGGGNSSNACDAGTCNQSAGGSGGQTGQAMELEVLSSVQDNRVGGQSPPPGEYFIVTHLRLVNHRVEVAPLVPALFMIRTQGGLEYFGDAVTALHEKGCPENARLDQGGALECTMVFRAPTSAVTEQIRYAPPGADPVTAPLETKQCTLCGDTCHDLGSDPAHCGACGNSVGIGQCVDGVAQCSAGATLCGTTCVDLSTDPAHCGACFASAGSAICVEGKPACPPGTYYCDGECYSPGFGACCDAWCAVDGMVCTEAHANYSGAGCEFTLAVGCSEIPAPTASSGGCQGQTAGSGCTCTTP